MKPFDLNSIIEEIFKDRRIYKYPILEVLTILIVIDDILSKEE